VEIMMPIYFPQNLKKLFSGVGGRGMALDLMDEEFLNY